MLPLNWEFQKFRDQLFSKISQMMEIHHEDIVMKICVKPSGIRSSHKLVTAPCKSRKITKYNVSRGAHLNVIEDIIN